METERHNESKAMSQTAFQTFIELYLDIMENAMFKKIQRQPLKTKQAQI